MKRMTALALAGMLFFGTACGGNQTNSDAAKADAGAAAALETAEGATGSSADESGSTGEEAAGFSAGAAEKNGSASGQNRGIAKGKKGDAIITADESVFTGDGTVTAFIGEPFYDGVIKDYDEAYKAVQSVYDRIGADKTTQLELAEIRPTEDSVCYTFYQIAGDIRVYGDAVKLITDNNGKAIGLISAILPNVKATPAGEWGISADEAEAIIEDYYKEDDLHAVDGHHYA